MELEWGVESLQNTKKKPNEDRYRLLGAAIPLVAKANRGQLFAVFDGIGSAPKGMNAAQTMCDALVFFFKDAIDGHPRESLRRLLVDTNRTINQWGCTPGTTKPDGGCAGTLAWFHEHRVVIFHAGDTAGYLLQEKRITPLTQNHGTGEIIENYFGLGEALLIDVFSLPVQESDVLILVTDGVTKTLNAPTIAEIVSTYNTGEGGSQRAAKELCRRARVKGSQDDITAVIVEIVDMEGSEA